ncbi:hypothetical protein IJG93_02835 [Candidatus Saccharibacteria bacterium]|nr:hypothetical protein [Candidatus Saccharibacteria bacterium]
MRDDKSLWLLAIIFLLVMGCFYLSFSTFSLKRQITELQAAQTNAIVYENNARAWQQRAQSLERELAATKK